MIQGISPFSAFHDRSNTKLAMQAPPSIPDMPRHADVCSQIGIDTGGHRQSNVITVHGIANQIPAMIDQMKGLNPDAG
jgi:hypothetical protein